MTPAEVMGDKLAHGARNHLGEIPDLWMKSGEELVAALSAAGMSITYLGTARIENASRAAWAASAATTTNPVPAWDELPEEVQARWTTVILAALQA